MSSVAPSAIGPEVTNGGKVAIEYAVPYMASVEIVGVADLLFHRWNVEGVETKLVAEEREGHLAAPGLVRLSLRRLGPGPLRVVRALELVIARRIPEQFLERRRMVVDRRVLDLDDALVGTQRELWTELQYRGAIGIHMHQVQSGRRHGDLDTLLRATVPAVQQRRRRRDGLNLPLQAGARNDRVILRTRRQPRALLRTCPPR